MGSWKSEAYTARVDSGSGTSGTAALLSAEEAAACCRLCLLPRLLLVVLLSLALALARPLLPPVTLRRSHASAAVATQMGISSLTTGGGPAADPCELPEVLVIVLTVVEPGGCVASCAMLLLDASVVLLEVEALAEAALADDSAPAAGGSLWWWAVLSCCCSADCCWPGAPWPCIWIIQNSQIVAPTGITVPPAKKNLATGDQIICKLLMVFFAVLCPQYLSIELCGDNLQQSSLIRTLSGCTPQKRNASEHWGISAAQTTTCLPAWCGHKRMGAKAGLSDASCARTPQHTTLKHRDRPCRVFNSLDARVQGKQSTFQPFTTTITQAQS